MRIDYIIDCLIKDMTYAQIALENSKIYKKIDTK